MTQYGGFQPPVARPSNGLGTAAMVLGLIAVLFAIVPIVGAFIAIPLGVLAIVLGFVGRGRVKRRLATNSGLALSGIILGLLALIIAIVWGLFVGYFLKDQADKGDITSSGGKKASTALGAGDTIDYKGGLKVTLEKVEKLSNTDFKATFKYDHTGKDDIALAGNSSRVFLNDSTKSLNSSESKDELGIFKAGTTKTYTLMATVPEGSQGSLRYEILPAPLYDAGYWSVPIPS
jgi:hypothetical protein